MLRCDRRSVGHMRVHAPSFAPLAPCLTKRILRQLIYNWRYFVQIKAVSRVVCAST